MTFKNEKFRPLTEWLPTSKLIGIKEFSSHREGLMAFSEKETWPQLSDYNHLLHQKKIFNHEGLLVQCVEDHKAWRKQKTTLFDDMYDASIYTKGHLPTRSNNYHDFFNMLTWSLFPKTKAYINYLQYVALKTWLDTSHAPLFRPTLPGARLRQQDCLALIDEGGVIVSYRQSARVGKVQNHNVFTSTPQEEEKRFCSELRQDLKEDLAEVTLFGHALFEHRVSGIIFDGQISGFLVFLNTEHAQLKHLDSLFSKWLSQGGHLHPRRSIRLYSDYF